MKISAIEFSLAGDKYLGRSYEEMDCQAFVEKCMADVGYPRDLGGSNSWYRECMKNGWTGTPEECTKEFGSVPKGALLFILEPVGSKTPAKFRDDGVGDVTHMGIVTGRGDGAIHSSKSRGGVVTSKFKGKTIPNGGWNRVGLLDVFEYEGILNSEFRIQNSELSAAAGEILRRASLAQDDTGGLGMTQGDARDDMGEEENMMRVIIQAENDGAVKLRQSRDPKKKEYAVWEEYPSGTKAEVLKHGETWSRIRVGNRTGWMMTEFLVVDDTEVQSEELRVEGGDEEGLLAEVYQVLRDLCEKIDAVIGRG